MDEVKMKLCKDPIKWIRWAFGILGILGLWNVLPRLMTSNKQGLLINYNYLIFFAILGLWIGLMFFIYRKKALFYRGILGIMIFLSLGLFVYYWFSVNTSLMNQNTEMFASLLLDLCLIASIIDPQFFKSKKHRAVIGMM